MNLLTALTSLLLCQLAGELVAVLTQLPVPGPVIGMAILFAALALRGGVPSTLNATANGLLAHLSLLFVPAGVGVMLHLGRIQAEWPAIVAALLVSTWLTLLVSVAVMRGVSRLVGVDDNEGVGVDDNGREGE